MVDDATFRSAVRTQRLLLGVSLFQVLLLFLGSTFSGLDRLVACVFWLALAAYSSFLLFTPGGRSRLRRQAKIGLPRTGLGLTIYWGAFAAMFAVVGVLLLVLDVPFWLLILVFLPVGFALTPAIKALTRWDARRFASDEFFFVPPPGRHPGSPQ